MTRLLKAAALALTIGVSTVPAFASTVDKATADDIITHVTKFTENDSPQFGCADPVDKTSCQTVRSSTDENGTYFLRKFAQGVTACVNPKDTKYADLRQHGRLSSGSDPDE